MKKIRVMALALIVAVALTGAGYAAWGTKITATTKLQTGNWNVVLENDSDWSYYAADSIINFNRVDSTKDKDTAYEKANYDNDGNYVYAVQPLPANDDGKTGCTFEFTNLHPGTKAMTRFEVRNRGTIPAKIEDVEVTIKDVAGNVINPNSEEAKVIAEMMVKPFFQTHPGTVLVSAAEEVKLSDLQGFLNTKLRGTTLYPNDGIHSYAELETGKDQDFPVFTFVLPGKALGDAGESRANVGMNAKFTVKIVFHFVQYNDVTAGI